MKPTIKDIARLAGVSPTTVSRVLNKRGYISQKTIDKVNEAMKELNYYPNELARSLYHQQTYFIGLIFPTTSNPFFGELMFHIENVCASLGYKVLLCNSLGYADKERSYLEMLQRNQVDGIIVGAHNSQIQEYQKVNLPIVAVDRYLSDKIPVVASDNYTGGKTATKWLLDQGCKKIIFITGSLKLEAPANKRRDGYENVMKEAGKTPMIYELCETLVSDSRMPMIQKKIQEIFHEHPDVDGIFASDDLIASIVFSEAKRIGKRLQKDLKVVGYDGSETVRICSPYLTTIKQPIKEIAEKAVQILIRQINGETNDLEKEYLLPIELIEGIL
ncbi:LacI family DNA-binding transcriptional regulator [Scopulibacillus cellulosilyticus]|uniref:LacI family DNA-binding transcriptional regulator n=1 Tax=Scopulibacillus cellulosilyticus TaxID=2665665 RepID=A0ABW2PYG6_9BACL